MANVFFAATGRQYDRTWASLAECEATGAELIGLCVEVRGEAAAQMGQKCARETDPYTFAGVAFPRHAPRGAYPLQMG